MSLLDDYALLRIRIDNAISEAMYAFEEPLKEQINQTSGEYDGPKSRRALFGGGTYEASIGSDSISVTNITEMQGPNYGIPEVVFVEEGMENYNMPGPRPFMEEAGKVFAEGEGEHILQTYLDTIV